MQSFFLVKRLLIVIEYIFDEASRKNLVYMVLCLLLVDIFLLINASGVAGRTVH